MAMKQIHLSQQSVKVSNWSTLFPHDTTTITGSEIFIKQLTALIFSCITHIRGIFPEHAFDDRILDERKLKVLNGNWDCRNAYLMTRWLKSAFKALDLQYMQTLTLEILTTEDQPLEYYAVDYSYTDNGPSCSFHANHEKQKAIYFSNSNVENATKKMVFALLDATEGLGDLPLSYNLQLRIHYYDSRTPVSYTPEYFINAPPCDWDKVQNLKRIKIGSVSTNYHSMTLSSGSTLVPSDGSDQPLFNYAPQNQNNFWEGYQPNDYQNKSRLNYWLNDEVKISPIFNQPMEVEMKIDETGTVDVEYVPGSPSAHESATQSIWYDISKNVTSASNDEIACASTISINSKEGSYDQTEFISGEKTLTKDSSGNLEVSGYEEMKINCYCSLTHRDNVFTCGNCTYLHHWVCYKFWPDARQSENMYCYTCSKNNDLICIDEHLQKCSEKQTKNLMIFRQLLFKSQYLKKLSTKIITTDYCLPEFLAKKYLKKFVHEGLTKENSDEDTIIINSKKLNQFINKYFHY